MKRIEETNIKISYKCETCGKVSELKSNIEECETQHACKHEKCIYEFNCSCEDFPEINGISKFCDKCHLEIGIINFEDLEYNNELKKELYEFIAKRLKACDK